MSKGSRGTSVGPIRARNARARVADHETVKRKICERLIEGESLRQVSADQSMPGRSTVARWLADDRDFEALYAAARRLQADALADEILAIADTPVLGVKTTTKADGTVDRVEGDMIEHRRLQVESRKWLASKLAPKKYGDATLLKHADADGEALSLGEVSTRIAVIFAEIADRSGAR